MSTQPQRGCRNHAPVVRKQAMQPRLRRAPRWLAACALSALLCTGCRRGTVEKRPLPRPDATPLAGTVGGNASRPAVGTPPAGYLAAHVVRVVDSSQGDVVLLADPDETRLLPIFIGGTEALSIKLRNDKQRYPRPLTHDLLDSIVDKLGGRIVKVHVDDIKNKVFIGRVYVAQGDRTFDVDARPSDAIALAVGAGVPVFVASAVFDAAALSAADLGLNEQRDGLRLPVHGKPEEPTQL